MTDHSMRYPAENEIDVRPISRQRRHPIIFEAYKQLSIGDSLILLNDHESCGLWDEFERELTEAFDWEGLPVTVLRTACVLQNTQALPCHVADTAALLGSSDYKTGDSIWQLEPGTRDLDSNIIVSSCQW